MWLTAYSIRNPKRVLVLSGLCTLVLAPGLTRLRLRTDGHALVPKDAPAIRTDRAIREEFGVHDPIVVLIETTDPEGIFNPHTLKLVRDLTDDLKRIVGIQADDVTSLATEHGHRVFPGTLTFRRFLEPLPDEPKELAALRDDLRTIKLYNSTIVSRDERAAAILAGVAPDADQLTVLAAVHEVIASKGSIAEAIHVIGAPAAETLLGSHILEDLGVPSRLVGTATRASVHRDSHGGQGTGISLRSWLGQRVGLVPMALGVMGLIFLLFFRSLTAAVLPLMEIGAALVFTFGLMGILNVPVYLTIAVMPVILTVIGVADEIHVFAHYAAKLRRQTDEDSIELLQSTMAEMGPPVVLTSLTTAVGFLSFALSPIAPVQAFGIFTAVGVLFCMFWSLTAIPASLALIKPNWISARRRRANGGRLAWEWWARNAVRRRAWILAFAVLLIIAAPLGIRRVIVQDSWIDGFAEDSGFRQAIERFNREFLGMHMLLVRTQAATHVLKGRIAGSKLSPKLMRFQLPADIDPTTLAGRRIRLSRPSRSNAADDAKRSTPFREWSSWIVSAEREGEEVLVRTHSTQGIPQAVLRIEPSEELDYEIWDEPFKRPEVLERMDAFQAFLASQRDETVGGVIGPPDYVKTTNLMRAGLKESERVIPSTPERVDQLWDQYERIRGQIRLRQVVNRSFDAALTTVFLKNANFVDVGRLIENIRRYEQEHLRPAGLSLEFAGDVAVSQTLIGAIVSTQVRSLIGSVLGAGLMMVLLGRSLKRGVLCLIPCSLSVLVNFAVMGWTGMPLGVASSMFAAMTLGIADDFAIHLADRHQFLRRRGADAMEAVVGAVRDTGPAIVLDALAVGLGFAILTLSQVPANARLGVLVILSLGGCLLATMALLPALLSLFSAKSTSRLTADE